MAPRAIGVEDEELPIAGPRGMSHPSAVLTVAGREASPPEQSGVSADLDAALLIFESFLSYWNNDDSQRALRKRVCSDLACNADEAPGKNQRQHCCDEA